MNTLTERIRAAREEAGFSQPDVARALRISASAVNQWEHGFSKNIKLPTFFALSRVRGTAAMPPAPDFPAPTGEERALLHDVRQLPTTLRRVLLQFVRGLCDVYVSFDKDGR